MQIKQIKLTNFRNYNSVNIDFNDHINIFVGNNGQGKTNILESIYVLSLTKSNRYGLDSELIKFNENIARIEGLVKDNDVIRKNEIEITPTKKKLSINGKEIRKNRDYIRTFCTISFTPDDLEIIKGAPNIRRNTINIDMSQVYPDFINYLTEYNAILKMRNEYLKKLNINGNSDYRYLEILNDKLIEKACKIYENRYDFIEKINKNIGKIFKKITGIDGLSIIYENSLNINEFDKNNISKKYYEKLKKNLNNELMNGMTTIGPHRDDLKFMINHELDMKNFGSQGQQRMAVIAFKLSELLIFKEILGSYPVLLLDDIFSEIDIKKRNNIIKFLKNDIQTIITTTDINDINEKLLENAFIYNIDKNCVTKRRLKYERRKK